VYSTCIREWELQHVSNCNLLTMQLMWLKQYPVARNAHL
jgi:hypothetical protein